MLPVSDPELRALATGESVVVFAERSALTEGDEVELAATGPLPPERLKPAYRGWGNAGPPHGEYSAVVVSVDPAAILDPVAAASRHILAAPGDGDVLVLRIYSVDGPVLSDVAFEARRRSVEGAHRQ